MVKVWGKGRVDIQADPNAPHEAGLLQLAIDKARYQLGWRPRWDFERTVTQTATWYKAMHKNENMIEISRRQIAEHMGT